MASPELAVIARGLASLTIEAQGADIHLAYPQNQRKRLTSRNGSGFTLDSGLVPNGHQSRGLHALAYRILEVFLQTGAVLRLMVVRQSYSRSGQIRES